MDGHGRRRADALAVVWAAVVIWLAIGTFGANRSSAEIGAAYIQTGVLTSIGGNGGNAFGPTGCANGSMAVGARAQEKDDAYGSGWAGMYSLLCRPITASGLGSTVSATPPRGTDSAFTTPLVTASCPSGQVITGMHIFGSTSSASTAVLSETYVRCRTLSIVVGVPTISGGTTEVPSSFTAQGTDNDLGTVDCAAGEFLIGFQGRQGGALDQFAPYCARFATTTYTAQLAFTSFAMPTSGFTVSVHRSGGSTDAIQVGSPTPLWAGTYDTAVAAPSGVIAAWLTTSTSGACSAAALVDAGDATCTVTVTGAPHVRAGITPIGSATAGRAVDVRLQAGNVGPASATPTITLGSAQSFQVSWPATCVSTTATSCTLGSLAAATSPGTDGGTREVIARVTFAAAGSTGLLAVAGAPGDNNGANDAAGSTFTVDPAPVVTTTTTAATTPTSAATSSTNSTSSSTASTAPATSVVGPTSSTDAPSSPATPSATTVAAGGDDTAATDDDATNTTTQNTTTRSTTRPTSSTTKPTSSTTTKATTPTAPGAPSTSATTPNATASTTASPTATSRPATTASTTTGPAADDAAADPASTSTTAVGSANAGGADPALTTGGDTPELDPGTGSALGANGTSIRATTTVANGSISVSANDVGMQVSTSDARAVDSSGVVIWAGTNATVNGRGFAAGSDVQIWMFSTPRLLGTISVGSDGTFAGTVPVPADMPPGAHTIQSSGTTAGGEARAVNAGVVLAAPDAALAPYLPTAHAEDLLDVTGQGVTVIAIAGVAMGTRSTRKRLATSDASSDAGTDGAVDNSTMLAVVDFTNEGTADERVAWGDGSRSWRWRWTASVDSRSATVDRWLAVKLPLFGRVLADGAYLRAALGAMWLALPVIGVGLGGLWAAQVSGSSGVEVLPPTTWLLAVIITLGILDATAGLAAVATFAICALVTGGIDSAASLRGLLGLGILGFGISLTAGAMRPLRHQQSDSPHRTWRRLADVGVGTLFGAWTAEIMLQALPGMLGVDVPVADAASRIAWVAVVALLLRFGGESLALRFYPRRLAECVPLERDHPSRRRILVAMCVRIALFVFITAAVVGTGPILWIAGAVFALPQVLIAFADDLPNLGRLYRYMPRGILLVTILMVAEFVWATWLTDHLDSASQMVTVGFMLMLIPSTVCILGSLVVREGPDWSLQWSYRWAGLAVVTFALWFSRWSLWWA